MERKNYIVKLKMSKEELSCFRNLEPLLNLSMSPNESNLISRLLGYEDSYDLTKKGYKSNRFLRQAFQVLAFLYVTREDSGTFIDFWDRLIFTDKEVESKVRRTFNIVDSRETLSSSQLELMWLLDTDKDELDTTDSDSE
tara:strand:+ start:28907 stop:29326 length:420 start_codon:yes stop_codon:yes gene_type:complete